MPKLKRILIANRGEIAIRIQEACRKLGKKSVSVCSEADKEALFIRKSDEYYLIGPAPASESYLDIQKIIDTALESGCDAVHPGYGFLSENAEFAQRVSDSGLKFIGPTADSIDILGNKTKARSLAEKLGLPLPKGSKGGLTDDELINIADEIVFPLMIKASAGGGGRGMRVAHNKKELKENLPRARAEAKKFFSNDEVYIERRIINPRHVEVQIMGDSHGNVLHFGTRDCSAQRRNQKLIEEAPAPDLADELREKIHGAAVLLAKEINYENAGTVEFLVKENEFFFLEMNTRIQVEHPVTEIVTDTDLVALQIEVAEGKPLPLKQKDVKFNGHAIEYRIYAEDPKADFRPSLGTISSQSYGQAENLRIDNGFEVGDRVTPYYDAMLSKVIVKGKSREETIVSSIRYLTMMNHSGIETNKDFHLWFLERTPFIKTPVDISFLEREFTAEIVLDYNKSKIIDPYHKLMSEGLCFKERFEYQNPQSEEAYIIELTHLEDGTFLAAPLDKDGKYPSENFCRRSNGHQAALESLGDEVFAVYSREQIFN